MKIGCQSITFRNATPPWPLPAALQAIARAGFEGVELAAGSVDLASPEALQALLGSHGLELAALHLNSANFDPAARPQNPVDTRALARCVGACRVPFVLTSGTGGRAPADLARVLNAGGRELAAAGATLCYHNHGQELQDGARWLADFCAAADGVGLAFDLGWAVRVGADPAALVRRFAAHIRYVHVKDTAGDAWMELGRGEVDLPPALEAVRALNLPWVVAEQDRSAGDPAASVAVNAAYLLEWRRAGGA